MDRSASTRRERWAVAMAKFKNLDQDGARIQSIAKDV
jgi:hypothetical protein